MDRALQSSAPVMVVARLGTVILLLTYACAGCAGSEAGDAADAAAAGDGGDALFTDADASRDADWPGPVPDAAPRADGGPTNRSPELAGGESGICYDGVDNDEDGQKDCDAAGCASADPVCCVDSSDPACCEASPTALALTIPAACADGQVSSCTTLAEHLTFFGAESPVFEGGRLVPQGGAGEGGVAIGGPIDARDGLVSLRGVIDVPATRCSDCVDAGGLGFIEAIPAPGARAAVHLGVLVIGARREIVVLLGDEVIARETLRVGQYTYAVGIDAGRRAWYELADGARVEIDAFAPPETLVPAAFGRTQNRSAGEGAVAIRSATLEVRRCEAPRALVRREARVFPSSTSTYRPVRLGRPSAARDEAGRVWVAVAIDGALHLLGENGIRELVGEGSDPGDPILSPGVNQMRLSDPWLATEDGRFVLYYVLLDDEGDTSVWRAPGAPGFARRFTPDAAPLLRASELDLVAELGAPTVFSSGASGLRMIAAIRTAEGSRLAAFEPSGPDGAWQLRGGELETATVVRAHPEDLFAFDRDSIGAPAVVLAPDARGTPLLRLYYGGTRGTRSAIGLLVSEQGVHWRPIGTVLRGDETGFDALGVTDPAPLLTDGRIELLYRGSDGVRSALGRAGPTGTVGE